MTRVLVLGPGPARPGVSPAVSVLAADFARAFVDAGAEVVALDAAPTSSLLWTVGLGRRYLEPLRAATVQRIREREQVDTIAVNLAGPVILRGLTAEGCSGLWTSGGPAELVAATRQLFGAEARPTGEVIDVVVASDARDSEILAALACSTPAHVALADGDHTMLDAVPAAVRSGIERHLARERAVGLTTLRCVGAEVVAVDRIDPSLWTIAGLVRGSRPGFLFGALASGGSLADAMRASARGKVAVRRRLASFDFEPYPGANRTLTPISKSVGATLSGDEVAAPPSAAPSQRRVVIVGPGEVSAGHGSEASLATSLAAREASRLGHEVVVLTAREGTGADASAARVHLVGGAEATAAVLAREAPADVLVGFGADPGLLAVLESSDLGTRLPTWAPPTHATPPDATEVHVVVLSDGERAKVVGTFEHVERAAVHPDDAAAVFPALLVDESALRLAEEHALALAVELGVRGIFTGRFAIHGGVTAWIGAAGGVSTHALSLGLALGVDLVAEALRLALGGVLSGVPFAQPPYVAVEEHVFPFAALGASDTRLERRPRSTGSVLALGDTVAQAYARALAAMGVSLQRPASGGERTLLLAGAQEHASALADVGRRLYALGFDLVATEETANWLGRARVPHRVTNDPVDLVSRRRVVAVAATADAGAELRRAALVAGLTCFTTVDLLKVAEKALELDEATLFEVRSLDERVGR